MPDAKIAITEDLVLDFTGLFSAEPQAEQAKKGRATPFSSSGEDRPAANAENPAESRTEGQTAKQLYLRTQREREDHQRSLEVYRSYQGNIKTSSQLQADILKGIKAGEDIYSLFLKAAKAISLMTSNKAFYSQIEADISAIYGRGLHQRPPLQKELVAAQERLTRLLDAAQREGEPEDSRARIQSAVKAHRALEEQLQELIKQAEGGESVTA